MVFGHRKCSGGTGYISGHRKGFRATPGKDMGLMGQVREHTSPQGAGAPTIWDGVGGEGKRARERKVWIRIPTSFSLPPLSNSFHLGYIWPGGARLGRDSK